MKVFIISVASILVFTSFYLFSVSSDSYLQQEEVVKALADDAAHAAALYYDPDAYGLGSKVYMKSEGNKAIEAVLTAGLSEPPINVYTYYFDQDGTVTSYKNKVQAGSKKVSFPYEFRETLTDYKKTVSCPTVIVTLEMADQRFLVPWIKNAKLIRTSAYEEPGR